jgi:hypothetical protein
MDVQPNQGGEILASDITANDILCGRGTKYCNHDGNKRYHLMVSMNCTAYGQAQSKEEKTKISRSIVESLRNSTSPSRFIQKSDRKENQGTEIWYEVGNKKAWDKTGQLLREMVSKGAHKTIYQKRKYVKELKRRKKQGKQLRSLQASSPSFPQHNPIKNLTNSCFSSGGSSSPGLAYHSIIESPSSVANSYLRGVTQPLPQDTIVRSPMCIQNINMNVGNPMINCNLPVEYYDFIERSKNISLPRMSHEVPTSQSLSNDPLFRLLLESKMSASVPYANPYISDHLSLIRNQGIGGASFAEYAYNIQRQQEEEKKNSDWMRTNASM